MAGDGCYRVEADPYLVARITSSDSPQWRSSLDDSPRINPLNLTVGCPQPRWFSPMALW